MSNSGTVYGAAAAFAADLHQQRQMQRHLAEERQKWNDLVAKWNNLVDEHAALQARHKKLEKSYGVMRARRLGGEYGQEIRNGMLFKLKQRGQLQVTRDEARELLDELLANWYGEPMGEPMNEAIKSRMESLGIPLSTVDSAVEEMAVDEVLEVLFPEDAAQQQK